MRFTLRTELDDEHELVSPNDMEWAVFRLVDEPGSFLVVEPESPIDGITYMQAAYIRKTKGIFRKTVIASYCQVEAQEEKANGDLYQYVLEIEDWDAILDIFTDFAFSERVPDFSAWQCELFCKAEE